MINFYLHGPLADAYGDKFELDARQPCELIHALSCQLDGFKEAIQAGSWHVVRGPLEEMQSTTMEGLALLLAPGEEVHLLPAMDGAGNGALTILVGAALIVGGVLSGGTTSVLGMSLIAGGAGTMVGGIIQATMKMPGVENSTESADNRASFLYNGPRNQSSQGPAVPRGYGRVRTGSIVISADLYAEDIAV